jgi:hypothetical protein
MNDDLSQEDQFRLNVLLAQEIKAIRLDESSMVLYALLGSGDEASMPLHANCRADKYLRLVREALSGHALGSPGGYPVYLSRWTRHGQMESANLGQLLLIGEPEAVIAVAHSPALTDEVARYAWWAMPTIEHARLMLMREAVAKGKMGRVLVDFLVEHLPFLQEDHLAIMDTVAVLLYSGILTPEQREAIWRRGKRQNSYYVAFLEMCPDALPDSSGSAFSGACLEILSRPDIQEVVSRTLNAIGRHYAGAVDEPGVRLAAVNAELVYPVFSRSTAIGSLMRRKLEPIIAPILADLRLLR